MTSLLIAGVFYIAHLSTVSRTNFLGIALIDVAGALPLLRRWNCSSARWRPGKERALQFREPRLSADDVSRRTVSFHLPRSVQPVEFAFPCFSIYKRLGLGPWRGTPSPGPISNRNRLGPSSHGSPILSVGRTGDDYIAFHGGWQCVRSGAGWIGFSVCSGTEDRYAQRHLQEDDCVLWCY